VYRRVYWSVYRGVYRRVYRRVGGSVGGSGAPRTGSNANRMALSALRPKVWILSLRQDHGICCQIWQQALRLDPNAPTSNGPKQSETLGRGK